MTLSETECYRFSLWMYPSKGDQHCNGSTPSPKIKFPIPQCLGKGKLKIYPLRLEPANPTCPKQRHSK